MEVRLRLIFLLVLCPGPGPATCPPGWRDQTNLGLGCLLFSSQSMAWSEAEQYCRSAASNASMIEILTHQVAADKNKIFSQNIK